MGNFPVLFILAFRTHIVQSYQLGRNWTIHLPTGVWDTLTAEEWLLAVIQLSFRWLTRWWDAKVPAAVTGEYGTLPIFFLITLRNIMYLSFEEYLKCKATVCIFMYSSEINICSLVRKQGFSVENFFWFFMFYHSTLKHLLSFQAKAFKEKYLNFRKLWVLAHLEWRHRNQEMSCSLHSLQYFRIHGVDLVEQQVNCHMEHPHLLSECLLQVPDTWFPSSFLLKHILRRQQMTAPVLESLPPMWETLIQFQGWLWPACYEHLGSK